MLATLTVTAEIQKTGSYQSCRLLENPEGLDDWQRHSLGPQVADREVHDGAKRLSPVVLFYRDLELA